jgi:hypothetical protein
MALNARKIKKLTQFCKQFTNKVLQNLNNGVLILWTKSISFVLLNKNKLILKKKATSVGTLKKIN